jgi:hypothetical protein
LSAENVLKSASCVLEGWGTKLPVILVNPDIARLINVSYLGGSERYEGFESRLFLWSFAGG